MRKVRKMLNTMSEAQRSVLQAAAAREDRLLEPPRNARGAVANALAARLIEWGWAKEIKAANGAPVWRRDAAIGAAYALRLTAKGLKAVAAASEGPNEAETSSSPTAAETQTSKAPARETVHPVGARGAETESESSDIGSATPPRAPRAGSKLADVLGMVCAETGATIGELSAAAGWLEHTTRAALTGLRRRGYVLSLTRGERDGASVYRITGVGGEALK